MPKPKCQMYLCLEVLQHILPTPSQPAMIACRGMSPVCLKAPSVSSVVASQVKGCLDNFYYACAAHKLRQLTYSYTVKNRKVPCLHTLGINCRWEIHGIILLSSNNGISPFSVLVFGKSLSVYRARYQLPLIVRIQCFTLEHIGCL